MEKLVLVSCALVLVIQTARAQNFADLFGLQGFGIAETQTSGSSSCPYQAHQDRRKFNQMVNNRLMTQECAPGTMFVLSKCSCDNIPKGGGPMPGSNPRMQPGLGGNDNAMINALISQLEGALGGAYPLPTPRPPPRNMSPMITNQLNPIRQKVTSGIRPDQSNGGSVAKVQKPRPAPKPAPKPAPRQAPSNNRPYMLDPTGLTSLVDPSLLPDILQGGLPPAVQKMFDRSSMPQTRRPLPTSRSPPTGRPSPTKPPSRKPTRRISPPTLSSQVNLGGIALPPGGLPNDVLNMLQQSIQPPRDASKKVNPGRPTQKKSRRPSTASNKRRKPSPSKSTYPRTPTSIKKATRPRPDPTAHLMAQLTRTGGTQKKPTTTKRKRPHKDPLAALLAGTSQPSRAASRGNNRVTGTKTVRGSSRTPSLASPINNGNQNPMAALMAGLGGGSSSSSTGGGADPFAAMMASMGGGAGSPIGGAPSNNNLAALMAGLGGGSNSGIASTSLAGNANAAAAIGGTAAAAKPKIIDMTNFFNAQGIMRGPTALTGPSNINFAKLHQLDLMEVIDLGDLTPAGLIAANAHFAKPGNTIMYG